MITCMRLIRRMRRWRACIRSDAARARSSMHAQHAGSSRARARAPQRSKEQSASAPRSCAAAAMWKQTCRSASTSVCTPSCWSCEHSEGARHVNTRLIRGMRTWRACIRSHAARARSSTCTLNMLWQQPCTRARRSAAGSGRQAHRDLERHHHAGANETARQSDSSCQQPSGERRARARRE